VTPAARVLAVIIGIAGLVVAMAALVRAAVLAAEPGLTWSAPDWWTSVTSGSSLATTIAAAVAGVVAAFLIVLAVRQVRRGSSRRPVLEFGGEKGQARLDVRALEKALERSVRASIQGAGAGRVTLTREPAGWFARLETQLPARDLAGAQEHVTQLLRGDLERLGGIRLDGVDLVVSHVTDVAPKATVAAGKKGRGATRPS
jgi:hypothetical protein